MLSSLYSSLPSASVVAPAFKQDSSDEKRIVSAMLPRPLEIRKGLTPIFAHTPLLPNKVGGRKKKGNRQMEASMLSVIKPIPASVMARHRFRFLCTAGGGYPISPASVFGAIGGIVDVVNSSLICWAGSFKIHEVTLYESAQSVASVSSGVVFIGTSNLGYNKDDYWTNTTIPYDRPTVVRRRPPPKSLVSEWISTGLSALTNTLFSIDCSIGSTVDLVVDFTLINLASPASISIAAGTLGGAFYLALDGAASNKLVPVGLPTTH